MASGLEVYSTSYLAQDARTRWPDRRILPNGQGTGIQVLHRMFQRIGRH